MQARAASSHAELLGLQRLQMRYPLRSLRSFSLAMTSRPRSHPPLLMQPCKHAQRAAMRSCRGFHAFRCLRLSPLCAPFAASHLPWLTPMLQQRHGLTWSQAHAMVPQRDLPSPPTLPWSQTYRPPFLSHKYCTRHARHHIPNSIALHAHRSHFTLRSQRRRQRVAHRLACARSASAYLRWTEELLELGARASCLTGHDQRRQTDACELYLFV